jgi:hypothetical protein
MIPKQISKISTGWKLVFCILCIMLAFGIIEKIRHDYIVVEFQKGRIRLDWYLKQNDPATNIYVSYYPNPPSVIILDYGLPLSAKDDLKHFINTNFQPLNIHLYYKNEPTDTNRSNSVN